MASYRVIQIREPIALRLATLNPWTRFTTMTTLTEAMIDWETPDGRWRRLAVAGESIAIWWADYPGPRPVDPPEDGPHGHTHRVQIQLIGGWPDELQIHLADLGLRF